MEETVIIGAGPAGLSVAGRMSKLGLAYTLLERNNEPGSAWHRHYDRLHLHTVKQYSHLPHLPFPDEAPLYVPRAQVCDYFEQYVEKMGIQPQYGQDVTSVKKTGDHWETRTAKGDIFLSQNVVICSGYNRKPFKPSWPGQDQFIGKISHSHLYKSGISYKGQKVLVVGMGNTGAEIALDLYEQGAQSFLSVRGPINIIRREVLGSPTQLTAMMLAKLPTVVGDAIGKFLSRVTIGDISPYGLERRNLAPAAQLRKFGKTPVIDVGTLDQIKAGNIKILPAIQEFHPQKISFSNGESHAFDAVILATGYKPAVEEFLEDTEGIFNTFGVPRAMKIPEKPGLYFLGFDAYKTGILQHVSRDSEHIVNMIKA